MRRNILLLLGLLGMMLTDRPASAQEKVLTDPLEILVTAENSCYRGYDEDCDGKLNVQERADLTTCLLRDFDLNGDKALDERELLVARHFSVFSQEYDRNLNGRLERSEREKQLAALLRHGDLNQDDELSLAELRDTVEFYFLVFIGPYNLGSILTPGPGGIRYSPELDVAQWRRWLDLLPKYYESVHDGRLDVAALKREAILCRFQNALLYAWPGYDVDKNGLLDRSERARMAMDLAGMLDLDGDGKVTAAELNEVAHRIRFLISSHPRSSDAEIRKWLAPPEWQTLVAIYLPSYDANQDGKLDSSELMTAQLGESVLNACFQKHPEFDLDHDKKMAPQEKQALVRWIAETYGVKANEFGYPNKTMVCMLEEIQLRREANPAAKKAALLDVCDFNHNGRFEPGEAQLAFSVYSGIGRKGYKELVAATVAKDRDGNLVPQAALMFVRHWDAWTRMSDCYSIYDRNQDCVLDLEEQAAALQSPPKLSDRNGNGHLEFWELQGKMAEDLYTKEVVGIFMTHEELARIPIEKRGEEMMRQRELATRLGDADGDGWIDEEERNRLMSRNSFIAIYAKRHPQANVPKGSVDADQIRTFLTSHLGQYDLNQDGQLDLQEMSLGMMMENEWATNPNVSAWELDSNGDGTISGAEAKTYLASLLPDYDANHNGRIEPAELWQKFGTEWALFRTLKEFPGIPRPTGQRMTATLHAALLAELAKRYDFNGNGKLDPEELKQRADIQNLLSPIRFLYPGLEEDFPSEKLYVALETRLLKDYDQNHNGRIDLAEAQILSGKLWAKAWEAERKFGERQAQKQQEQYRRQQDVERLKKYDFNGNGKLDPEERTRAKADAKAGIQAPARDE